jgi:hypothetical protein
VTPLAEGGQRSLLSPTAHASEPAAPAGISRPSREMDKHGQRAELDRFRKTHSDFAVRTTNEIDFTKVDKRPTELGGKQACAARTAFRPNGSVTLPRNHGNDVTLLFRVS